MCTCPAGVASVSALNLALPNLAVDLPAPTTSLTSIAVPSGRAAARPR